MSIVSCSPSQLALCSRNSSCEAISFVSTATVLTLPSSWPTVTITCVVPLSADVTEASRLLIAFLTNSVVASTVAIPETGVAVKSVPVVNVP